MTFSVRMSDLAGMSVAEQTAALDALVSAARSDSSASRAVINSRIRRFESRYEISSDEMLQRVASGEMTETAEVAEWLFWLDAARRASVPR